jgi:hypothetical protein
MALTADVNIPRDTSQELRNYSVKAATTIYQGAIVGLDESGDARGVTEGDRFVGIAYENCNNSAGADGATTVKVYTQGDFLFYYSGAAKSDVGVAVYATADDTIALTEDGGVFIGYVVRYDTTNYLVVRIMPDLPAMGNAQRKTFRKRLDCGTATGVMDTATIFSANVNKNGAYVLGAVAYVVEVFSGAGEDQGVVTLYDSDGTTLNATFTATDASADAVGDVIYNGGSATAELPYGGADTFGTSGVAGTKIAAGKGCVATVSTKTTGSGVAGQFDIVVDVLFI